MYINKSKNDKVIIGFCLTGICLFLTLIFIANFFHFNFAMESDVASEAILSEQIWISKKVIPDAWYSSTEARIISTPNIGALFYGISKDMSFAMGAACCVMTLSILGSAFWFFKNVADNVRCSSCLGTYLLLALPFNISYLKLVYLYAGYYAICIIVLFFTLATYGKVLRSSEIDKWGMGISVVLALGLGLQGMRGILVLYAPLLGIEIIRRLRNVLHRCKTNRADTLISIWVIVLLCASYLGTCFPFSVGQDISKNLRKGFNELFTVVIPDIGKGIGYSEYNFIGKGCVLLLLVLTVIVLIIVLYRLVIGKEITSFEWCYLVICSSPIITALIISFTTAESADRYFFMLMPAMALTIVMVWQKSQRGVKLLLAGYVILLSIVNICQIYVPVLQSDDPPDTEAYEVVSFLEENDCFSAYSTFEHANMMTVLSDGKVRVAPVASVSNMDICKWLSSEEWYPPNVPLRQRTAYIITEEEQESFKDFLVDKSEYIEEVIQIGIYKIYMSDFNFANLGIEYKE